MFGRTAPQVRGSTEGEKTRRLRRQGIPGQGSWLAVLSASASAHTHAHARTHVGAGAAAITLPYESLVRLPIADSTLIYYLAPSLMALLCWLILGEAVGWRTWAGCLASLLGMVLVAQPPALMGTTAVAWSHERLLGTAFGLCSAALAARTYVCIRCIGM